MISNNASINAVEVSFPCGAIVIASEYASPRAALCPACEAAARKMYPQNWRVSPGDTCKHGTFIMTDRDIPCTLCEYEGEYEDEYADDDADDIASEHEDMEKARLCAKYTAAGTCTGCTDDPCPVDVPYYATSAYQTDCDDVPF